MKTNKRLSGIVIGIGLLAGVVIGNPAIARPRPNIFDAMGKLIYCYYVLTQEGANQLHMGAPSSAQQLNAAGYYSYVGWSLANAAFFNPN